MTSRKVYELETEGLSMEIMENGELWGSVEYLDSYYGDQEEPFSMTPYQVREMYLAMRRYYGDNHG